MISPVTKRTALAAFCLDTLNAHRRGLRQEVYYRGADDPRYSASDQARVMGNPVYYMEVLHESGPERSPNDGLISGGKYLLAIDRFRVYFWLAYSDTGRVDTGSQGAWDDMLHSQTEGSEGLLYLLTQTLSIGESVLLRTPGVFTSGAPVSDVVPLNLEGTRKAHFCTFTVDLEG